MAERITHLLTELMGEDVISSHHGSMAAQFRLDTEQRLKNGDLKAVVATASLELGIDIGYIDLVIQIGSPRSIATFLQRVGRSGHSLGLIPKGRLFALTRDELYECMSLIRAIRGGRLDRIPIPTGCRSISSHNKSWLKPQHKNGQRTNCLIVFGGRLLTITSLVKTLITC